MYFKDVVSNELISIMLYKLLVMALMLVVMTIGLSETHGAHSGVNLVTFESTSTLMVTRNGVALTPHQLMVLVVMVVHHKSQFVAHVVFGMIPHTQLVYDKLKRAPCKSERIAGTQCTFPSTGVVTSSLP